MSELIDRQAAIRATWQEPSYTDPYNVLTEVRDRIEALPNIDTVPVVRCKDCKWYSIYEAKKDGTPDKRYSPSVCLRGIYAKRRDPEWFCADGERREG